MQLNTLLIIATILSATMPKVFSFQNTSKNHNIYNSQSTLSIFAFTLDLVVKTAVLFLMLRGLRHFCLYPRCGQPKPLSAEVTYVRPNAHPIMRPTVSKTSQWLLRTEEEWLVTYFFFFIFCNLFQRIIQ